MSPSRRRFLRHKERDAFHAQLDELGRPFEQGVELSPAEREALPDEVELNLRIERPAGEEEAEREERLYMAAVERYAEARERAAAPITREQVLELRTRQERWYTLFMAQQIADGWSVLGQTEWNDLNRLGRFYFGRDFEQLVQDCREMTAFNEEQGRELSRRPQVA